MVYFHFPLTSRVWFIRCEQLAMAGHHQINIVLLAHCSLRHTLYTCIHYVNAYIIYTYKDRGKVVTKEKISYIFPVLICGLNTEVMRFCRT